MVEKLLLLLKEINLYFLYYRLSIVIISKAGIYVFSSSPSKSTRMIQTLK